MLRDITLGQYYQTESVVHRLDPRVKLMATVIFIISLFVVNNFWGYLLAAGFLALVIRLSHVPFKFMVKGMKAEDALKLTNKEIAEALGGLPKEKMHCSVMGQEALEAAIRQWKGETPVPHAHEEGRLVCKCFGITDAQIIRAIRENGLKTVEEITKQKPLTELRPVSKPRMTNVQRMQLVMKTIEEEIRPQLAADGGDIELVDVDGKRVVVSLRGRCAQCRSSEVTIRNLVERVLREHVEADIVVEEA